MNENIVLTTYLNWKIESEVKNENLYTEKLKPIPDQFETIEEWVSFHFPHLLEDTRMAIAHHFQHPENLVEANCDLSKVPKKSSRPFQIFRPAFLTLKNQNNVRSHEKDYYHDEDDEDQAEEVEDKFARSMIGVITYQPRKADGTFDTFEGSFLVKVLMLKTEKMKEAVSYVWLSNDCAVDIKELSDMDWKLYVFPDASLTPSERISNGLEHCRYFDSIKMIEEILSREFQGEVLVDEVYPKLAQKGNESQRLAVDKVLTSIESCNKEVLPSIQLIQGPPGTGKSTTIIDIIFHLLKQNKDVCATAPTNFAICEIAKRAYLEAIEIKYPIHKIVLYGNEQRLKLNDDLNCLSLDQRIARLKFAANKWSQNRLLFMEMLSGRKTLTEPEKNELIQNCIKDLKVLSLECPSSLLTDPHRESLELLKRNLIIRDLQDVEYLKNLTRSFDPNPLMKCTTWKRDILSSASLLFCTVSSVSALKYNGDQNYINQFKYIIVDEATQLLEVSTSILLSEELECLILVGDDKQLPATVISEKSRRLGYDKSLFERLMKTNFPSTMLKIQYRMHPNISYWPSLKFYASQLVDGDNVKGDSYSKPWHRNIPPLSFLDVPGNYEEADHTGSKFNFQEVIMVKNMIHHFLILLKEEKNRVSSFSLGIISPYAAQVRLIQSEIDSLYFPSYFSVVCSSVDGFQGKECDAIIFSSVRSGNHLGFVSDLKRFNVAITRAKYSLILIGNYRALSNDKHLEGFFRYSKDLAKLNPRLLDESRKAMMHQQSLKEDLWSGNHAIFNNTIWSQYIYFNEEFKVNINKQSDKIKDDLFKYLFQVCKGKWPKIDSHNTSIFDKELVDILFVRPFDAYNLIWRIDIKRVMKDGYTTWSQIIKIIHFCSDNATKNIIEREGKSIKKLHFEQLLFCKRRNISNSKIEPILNERIEDSIITDIVENKKKINELIQLEEDCEFTPAIEKTYALNSDVVKLLLNAKEGDNIQLPHDISGDEASLIDEPGPQFVLGRSGTGKTTVMLYRMLKNERNAQQIISQGQMEKGDYKQLLVTASPILAMAIRESYLKLSRNSLPDSSLTISSSDIDRSQANQTLIKLDEPNSHEFPMITTFDSLLRMIDLCLLKPFQHTSKGQHGTQIDFNRFQNIYFSQLGDVTCHGKYKLNAAVLYKEFISVIKGDVKPSEEVNTTATNNTMENICLSQEEYLQLSKRRESTFSTEERSHIYQLFKHYQDNKAQSHYQDYDISDFTNYVYNKLSHRNVIKMRFQVIFIDEVQDLTMKQIAILKFCCSEWNGYFFAGDTAQTITQGVGFRFQSLKDLFHNNFIPYFKSLSHHTSSVSRVMEVPDIKQLKQNFRTHNQILQLANTVINLILYFFPESMDKVEDEISSQFGPHPIFLSDTEDVISNMFQRGEIQNCEFGSDQVILVRDLETKLKLKEVCGSNALVLTVHECKGMEFSDILIYDFFSSSNLEHQWRVIANAFEKVFAIQKIKCPLFDMKTHLTLCQELKMLYVLITRAKQRVFIFEKSKEIREPILFLWKQTHVIKEEKFNDDMKQILTIKSTPEEWCQRGHEFFHRQDYENARLCFQRGGDIFHRELCNAKLYILQGDAKYQSDKAEAHRCYQKAAHIYEQEPLKDFTLAADFYAKGEGFDKAGSLYAQIQSFSKAAENYMKAKKWPEAAENYRLDHKIPQAVDCYYKNHSYNKALDALDEELNLPTTSLSSASANCVLLPENHHENHQELIKLRQDCIKRGADHHYSISKTTEMLFFVRKMLSNDDQRKYLNRRQCYQLLIDLELEQKNFEYVAKIYLDQGQYGKASEVYKQAENHLNYVIYQLKHYRLLNIDATQHPVVLTTSTSNNKQAKAAKEYFLELLKLVDSESLKAEIKFWLNDLLNIKKFYEQYVTNNRTRPTTLETMIIANYPESLRIRVPWLIIRHLIKTYDSSDVTIPWDFINKIIKLFDQKIVGHLLKLIEKLFNPLTIYLTAEETIYYEQLNDLFGLRINTKEKYPIVSIECKDNAQYIQKLWKQIRESHDKQYSKETANETITGLTFTYTFTMIRHEIKAISRGYHRILFTKAEKEGNKLMGLLFPKEKYIRYRDEMNKIKTPLESDVFWKSENIQLVDYLLSREEFIEKQVQKYERLVQNNPSNGLETINKHEFENFKNQNKFLKKLKTLLIEEMFFPVLLINSELTTFQQLTWLSSEHHAFYQRLLELHTIIQTFEPPKQETLQNKQYRHYYNFDQHAKDMLILDYLSDERSEWILTSLLSITPANYYLRCLWGGMKKELDGTKTMILTCETENIKHEMINNIVDGRLLIGKFLNTNINKNTSPLFYSKGMMSPFVYMKWIEQTICIFILFIQGKKLFYLTESMFTEYFQCSGRLKKIFAQIIDYYRLSYSIDVNKLEEIKKRGDYLIRDLITLLKSEPEEMNKWFSNSAKENPFGRSSQCQNNETIASLYMRIINVILLYSLSTNSYSKKEKLNEIVSSIDENIMKFFPARYNLYLKQTLAHLGNKPAQFVTLCEQMKEKFYEFRINTWCDSSRLKDMGKYFERHILFPEIIEESDNERFFQGDIHITLVNEDKYQAWEDIQRKKQSIQTQVQPQAQTTDNDMITPIDDGNNEVGNDENEDDQVLNINITTIIPPKMHRKTLHWMKQAREKCRKHTFKQRFQYQIEKLFHDHQVKTSINSVQIYLIDIFPSYYRVKIDYYSKIEELAQQINDYNQLLTGEHILDDVLDIVESFNRWIELLSPNKFLDRIQETIEKTNKEPLVVEADNIIEPVPFPLEIFTFCKYELPIRLQILNVEVDGIEPLNRWVESLPPTQLNQIKERVEKAKKEKALEEIIDSVPFPSDQLDFCEDELPIKLHKLDELYNNIQQLVFNYNKEKEKHQKKKSNPLPTPTPTNNNTKPTNNNTNNTNNTNTSSNDNNNSNKTNNNKNKNNKKSKK